MEGISRTSGAGPVIQLRGESFSVSGRIMRHYAEIEAQIIFRRGNPFELVRQAAKALAPELDAEGKEIEGTGVDVDIVEEVISRCVEQAKTWRHVSQFEFQEFLTTWPGFCMATWLAIRDNDRKRLTLDVVTRMLGDEFEDRQREAKAQMLKAEEEGKKLTPDEAYKFSQEWVNAIERAIDQAGGEDEQGNSTGSGPSQSENTSEATPEGNESSTQPPSQETS